MAPTLFHGLTALGLPVICIESRQAYQALKSLATHKTDCNDPRGLAPLARTGFFKPVHVESLPAHAVHALIIARKKLVGQRVTLENQIRGPAVVFGIRLPRGLSPRFTEQVIQASQGISGLSSAMQGLLVGSLPATDDHSGCGLADGGQGDPPRRARFYRFRQGSASPLCARGCYVGARGRSTRWSQASAIVMEFVRLLARHAARKRSPRPNRL